jgi:hypothetical protein
MRRHSRWRDIHRAGATFTALARHSPRRRDLHTQSDDMRRQPRWRGRNHRAGAAFTRSGATCGVTRSGAACAVNRAGATFTPNRTTCGGNRAGADAITALARHSLALARHATSLALARHAAPLALARHAASLALAR